MAARKQRGNIMANERFDIHQHITDKIVSAIERGAGEFRLPWHRAAGDIMRPVHLFEEGLPRRQRRFTLGLFRGTRLQLRHMGHLPPMGRGRRAGPQGRESRFRHLLQGSWRLPLTHQ